MTNAQCKRAPKRRRSLELSLVSVVCKCADVSHTCSGPSDNTARVHSTRVFSVKTVNVFSLPYDFLTDIVFPLADFIVSIRSIIHKTYKISVNGRFLLWVRLSGQQ